MGDDRLSRRITLIQSPLRDSEPKTPPALTVQAELGTHDETPFENPQFRQYEQTSNIQLFFDLFFVATLATFTNELEVNTEPVLISYIAVFCMLWFTWCQVTLYDVRFSADSIFERLAHACHFGVMAGFAVVAPPFQDPERTPWATLQQFSLILMMSRLVLFCQYGTTLAFTWRFRTTRNPIMLVMAARLFAAIMYLVTSVLFALHVSANVYLGWYVIAVTEVAANLTIARHWHVVASHGIQLVERMRCLTLIILGEGVIGLCRSIEKIEDLVSEFSPATIGSIISATVIIYVVYQLYFDNICVLPASTVKQQLFSILHFPFHLALVLLMEGISQFIIWRHMIEKVRNTFPPLHMVDSKTATQAQISQAWNNSVQGVYTLFPATQSVYNRVNNNLRTVSATSNSTAAQISTAYVNLSDDLFVAVFDGFGFVLPQPAPEGIPQTIDTTYDRYFGVFGLVFGYFFIAAGSVLVLLAILSFISLPSNQAREKSPSTLHHRYVAIVVNAMIGVALMLLSTLTRTQAMADLGESAWPLPMLLLALLTALVLNHVRRPVFRPQDERGGGEDPQDQN